jgi:hypothetical protein
MSSLSQIKESGLFYGENSMIKVKWLICFLAVGLIPLVSWMISPHSTNQINSFSLGASFDNPSFVWSSQILKDTRLAPRPNEKTILVRSTDDQGSDSLRQALLSAQGGETILFDPVAFPPDDPATIFVLSPLPDLAAGGVIIDGTNAGVILDGSQLPREQPIAGLNIISSANVIRGLIIVRFSGSGIMLIDEAKNNTIGGAEEGQGNVVGGNWDGINIVGSHASHNLLIGNYIGTDASGTIAVGNLVDGIWIGEGAQYNQVGGTAENEGNLISGNGSNGVILDGSMHNVVCGNYIGTDISGKKNLGNQNTGVGLAWGAKFNTIGGEAPESRNIISGNGMEGIWLGDEGTMSNTVSGNYIGTDNTGTVAIPNGGAGINLGESTQYNLIGGDLAEQGNLISGNQGEGVSLSGAGVLGNIVSGNYIGTDATGNFAIGNSIDGIGIRSGAQDNRVGGDEPEQLNLISGNGMNGVSIGGSLTKNNTVIGNHIGTDISGTGDLGNIGNGIFIHAGAASNTIGSSNTIAYNKLAGIVVQEPRTMNNKITGNSIYGNAKVGIQIQGGANKKVSPASIDQFFSRSIIGTTQPGFTVEVFSDEGDQGRIIEGSTTADENGNFEFTLPAGRFSGPNLTTTITDIQGNTSVFSTPVVPPTPRVTRELPDIVAATQVTFEPQVVGTNLSLALFCVLFFGFTSTIFNQILRDYRDDMSKSFAKLIPRKITESTHKVSSTIHSLTGKRWWSLLLIWLLVLLISAAIESFLDCEIKIFCFERFSIILTLFTAAIIVSGLEWISDLYAHRRWARTTTLKYKIQWSGLFIALVCVIFSRALDFRPGYLYGIIGAIYIMPRLEHTDRSGKRSVLVMLAIFLAGIIMWVFASILPITLVEFEPVLLTIFLISLQGVFFQLFPFTITDGGDIWKWKKGLWFVIFLGVFFCFYHFLLNPNSSDVQALQQNGVQILLLMILVFGAITLALWLLFPFRLNRKLARLV